MTRRKALLILLILWAAIYLPGLGSTELKGEEGRRILPAVTMLETGNWLVPYVGGKPYLRKPPLMNWFIALSFKATGIRNEWTARLPSALAVLAMGATIVGLSSGAFSNRGNWISARTGLIAAVMAMTFFGLLSKARFAGAEIEGIYVPLFGIAITCWLALWARAASPWLTWTLPFVFLGLGALAKGPIHLLFFYGIIGAVLWVEDRWRSLFHPAHLAGIVIMSGIFAAWAVPYFQTEATSKASKVWKDQIANRVVENRFDWKSYVSNVPRGVGDLLPWIVFTPVVLRGVRRVQAPPVSSHDSARHPDARAGDSPLVRMFTALLISSIGMCLVLLLIPGVLPRYVLPLGIPIALAIAFHLPDLQRKWVIRGAILLALLSVIYGALVVSFIAKHDDLRPLAAQVDAAVGEGASLTVYDPGYQPALFYLQSPYHYAPYLEDIPPESRFILARAKDRKKFAEKRPDLKVTQEFTRRGQVELILLQR